MEDKREFNDILIDDRAQYQNRSKKIMLLVVAVAVLLIILLISAIAMSGADDKPQTQQVAQENGLQPQDQAEVATQTSTQNVEFEPVQTADAAANDRFEQIVKQIQDRQNAPQTTQNTESKPAPTQAPILETASQASTPVVAQAPAQPQAATKPTPAAQPTPSTQPTQAPKPAPEVSSTQPQQKPQATAKPAQPTKPTPVAQPTQVAQAPAQPQATTPQPRPQPTPSANVDKSKNGQVAQKGHYIQVGSFENTPNKDFLNKINNYSYRVYGAQNTTKYLIGPYDSRTDANRDMLKVKTDMGDQVFYFEVK